MKSFLVQLSIFCCVLFILPQCTHLRTPSSISVYRVCSPQQILLEFKEEKGIPAGLKGIAKIRVESPDKKFSVKEVIVAKRPQCLRLETLSPLGHPLFFIVTDGRKLFLFSTSENKFYHGVASKKNISLLFPVNLSLEKTVSIMLGKVLLIDYDSERVECQRKGDFCELRLSTKDGKAKQVLKLSLNGQKVVESETYTQGEGLVLSTTYRHYERVGEALFPREITVSMPHDKTKVYVNYKKIELLSEINSAEFKLEPPQGVEVIPLE